MITLITGSSGFLGHTIAESFKNAGEKTITLARSNKADIRCDLSKIGPIIPGPINKVIHAAGLAHVPAKINNTHFEVNYQGTLHLLKAIDNTVHYPSQFIFISTVAVYGLTEGKQIKEDHPLASNTSYGLSKIKAEEAIMQWCNQHQIPYYIFRLPLIVGPNPPGNLGAMIRSVKNGRYLKIKHNHANKSMVLASDIAALCRNIQGKQGIYHLTDNYHPSFEELERVLEQALNKKIKFEIPAAMLRFGGNVGDLLNKAGIPFPLNSDTVRKLTCSLTFSDAKARAELKWTSHFCLDFLKTLKY